MTLFGSVLMDRIFEMINQLNGKCLPFVALMLLTLSACSWDRQYEVTRFTVGEGRTIIISAAEAWEISQPVYYEVKVGEEIVASMCVICWGDADSLTFNTVYASGGNLVGLYEETRPDRLLLLHDFSTGMSWPRSLPTESSAATDSRGARLLSAIKKEHPDKNFTISWGDSCRLKP
jgi:hypothetical protein